MALALLLLSIVPHDGVVEDRVDLIELNHYFDNEGRPVFDQLIFWEWTDRMGGRFICRDFRIVKHHREWPDHQRDRGEWTVVRSEGESVRRVSSPSFVETWTLHDPELRVRQRGSEDPDPVPKPPVGDPAVMCDDDPGIPEIFPLPPMGPVKSTREVCGWCGREVPYNCPRVNGAPKCAMCESTTCQDCGPPLRR